MLKYGSDNGLPETYRITLALSVALLVHTLLIASFPFQLPDYQHNPVTVQVQLTPKGSPPASNSPASEPDSPVIATPFSIDRPWVREQSPSLPVSPAARPRKPAEPVSEPEHQAEAAARSSAQSAAGEPAENRAEEQQEEFTMKSEKPEEELDYIARLARHIGRHGVMSKRIARQIALEADGREGDVITLELELTLMSNGALTGARIRKPSGNDELDQRAYRAALAASPYPEPPGTGAQQRFEVELRYKL